MSLRRRFAPGQYTSFHRDMESIAAARTPEELSQAVRAFRLPPEKHWEIQHSGEISRRILAVLEHPAAQDLEVMRALVEAIPSSRNTTRFLARHAPLVWQLVEMRRRGANWAKGQEEEWEIFRRFLERKTGGEFSRGLDQLLEQNAHIAGQMLTEMEPHPSRPVSPAQLEKLLQSPVAELRALGVRAARHLPSPSPPPSPSPSSETQAVPSSGMPRRR